MSHKYHISSSPPECAETWASIAATTPSSEDSLGKRSVGTLFVFLFSFVPITHAVLQTDPVTQSKLTIGGNYVALIVMSLYLSGFFSGCSLLCWFITSTTSESWGRFRYGGEEDYERKKELEEEERLFRETVERNGWQNVEFPILSGWNCAESRAQEARIAQQLEPVGEARVLEEGGGGLNEEQGGEARVLEEGDGDLNLRYVRHLVDE